MTDINGILQMTDKGTGFLRLEANRYLAGPGDPFVPKEIITKHNLSTGLRLECELGKQQSKNQGPPVSKIIKIENNDADTFAPIQKFDDIVSLNPFEQLVLETGPENITNRLIDLVTPIGKGQRAMIVSPPKAGKTTILKDIAHGITANHPECSLLVLLADERPEEVTDIRRSITGEVFASSSDRSYTDHAQLAVLVFERCKRLLEMGKDVVLLLDSLTRMARAFNLATKNSGRTLSGGLDSRAMEKPKRFFGAARKSEKGGSLTVVATALIDTGSRMDQLIFEEFKGTGNMELILDRKFAEKYIWPAIDIGKSGTRKEEKILPQEILPKIYQMRRALSELHPEEAIKKLIAELGRTSSNKELLDKMPF